MSILAQKKVQENTNSDRAVYRCRLARSVAVRVQQGAKEPRSQALGDLLSETSAAENFFYGEDLHTQDGECFDGHGALVVASSRLDVNYIKQQSSRARKRLSESLGKIPREQGCSWFMVTLTSPRLLNCSLTQTKEVLDRAAVHFRKSKVFQENVRGGSLSRELTPGKIHERENREWNSGDGWNYHFHLLLYLKWDRRREAFDEQLRAYRTAWRDALLFAGAKFDVRLLFATVDGLPVVHFRRVTQKRTHKRNEISEQDALQESCKYVTKLQDLAQLPAETLLEFESVFRGKRLVETLGQANKRKGSQKKGENDSENFTENAEKERARYLDTTNTIDLKTQHTHKSKNKERTKKKESLLDIGERMIANGKRSEWLAFLSWKVRERRRARKEQLAARFPFATFHTLAGETWGWRSETEREIEKLKQVETEKRKNLLAVARSASANRNSEALSALA